MMNRAQFNSAVTALERVLRRATYGWQIKAVDNAPDTYKDLLETYTESGGVLLISARDHENVIWSSEEMNILFRAYHDMGHIKHELDFSFDNERIIGRIQAVELMRLALDYGYSRQTALHIHDIVVTEICEQINYYSQHKCYVPNQKEFAINKLVKRDE